MEIILSTGLFFCVPPRSWQNSFLDIASARISGSPSGRRLDFFENKLRLAKLSLRFCSWIAKRPDPKRSRNEFISLLGLFNLISHNLQGAQIIYRLYIFIVLLYRQKTDYIVLYLFISNYIVLYRVIPFYIVLHLRRIAWVIKIHIRLVLVEFQMNI